MTERTPVWVQLLVIVGVFTAVIVGFLLLVWLFQGPACLRGHDVPRFVQEDCHLVPMTVGDITVYITDCDPAHWTTDFVCDQWEVER